jgi:hypothetical protein
LSNIDETFFNAATLAYLMEQCQSLKALRLYQVEMDAMITFLCLAPIRGQASRSSLNATESQVLQPQYWQRSLEAIRAPSLMIVIDYSIREWIENSRLVLSTVTFNSSSSSLGRIFDTFL